jgi:hypothetical protein
VDGRVIVAFSIGILLVLSPRGRAQHDDLVLLELGVKCRVNGICTGFLRKIHAHSPTSPT